MTTTTGRCDSCEVVRINGMRCHETGCPAAWRDDRRECEWCGQEFKPEHRGQVCCDDECQQSYGG